ncbi:hypothetical protein K438DRAFT_1874697 [Mycena galopus ATCC 62051]|nr:hypothetical protein K438DRAFT_1874697 [Mycena galopus ATCC 62051]
MRLLVAVSLHGLVFLQLVVAQSNTASAALSQSTLPVGSCTASIPCSNGACCNSETGYCGYGASFCTTVADGGPCTSNCNAQAQCGPNAPAGEEECPLKVCCSQFGYCGTTEDFCGTGCMSNCNPAQTASCGADQQSALGRRIGYYEGWASSRSCDAWTPSTMNVDSLTHVNFAFASISSSFEVIEMTPGDSVLWAETTALKSRNPSLKVFLSIGGWSFNDPPTSGIFSALAASSFNTQTFIDSVLITMLAYGFDGIDIDWEYPVAEDRGGSPGDLANYPIFLTAIKTAFGPFGYQLSFTAPSSYWYLQNYDLPAMLADGAADWVNVMTYDLHGVWDSPADYIGSIVLAHTNLTEIELTFQLFANVGIDPAQLTMGIGFYGRSFELSSASCTDPGCPFAGAAPAGPCSANPGTLMFTEIDDMISSSATDDVVFDENAAVMYLVYNSIDWVSYDNAQTLGMKLQYANSICLGGTMIWSLDQDDTSYTALSALYGDVISNGANSSVTGDDCIYTGCGLSCPNDYTIIAPLQSNPDTLEVCTGSEHLFVCCPSGDAPSGCVWRGGSDTGICDGACQEGEITMATSPAEFQWIDNAVVTPLTCVIGDVALCCPTNEITDEYCFVTNCGVTTCPTGSSAFTTLQLGTDQVLGLCPSGTDRTLCCLADIGLTNCNWYGTVPLCLNNACPVGQTTIMTDLQGDASSSCIGGNVRNYCCDTPNASTFTPVDPGDIFPPSEINGDVVTFAVDYDDNEGTSDDTVTGDGSAGLSDDGLENDSPFSSVFISSPNAASVSSLDIESDWAITDCDPTSDQPQTALAYCTCPLSDQDCGCSHVFIGGAADTIVKLPPSCGLGPYARVVSLEINPDQSVLTGRHATKRIADPVYSLSFDYEFTAIDPSSGPVYMRADMTDMPGYWDSVINTPSDSISVRKRDLNFHHPRGMEKRWFGSFTDWLAKLNTLTASDSISRNYHWSDTYTIFHQEESCPNFQSSLDISVSGFAQVTSQFGYYLEATVVPPAVQQAYVYFKAGAGAEAAFTITGIASASWTSGRYELVNFGFPGLYYPGLLTLGPSLHLYGELSGAISLSGTLQTSVSYTFPSLDLSFGKQDSNAGVNNLGNPVSPTNNYGGADYSLAWNVELSGTADVHLIPSLQLGVSVLGGSLINAQVFVEADMFAGLSITGSVSNAVAPNLCISPQIGVSLNAGLTGSVLYWETGPLSATFYSATTNFPASCFGSVTEPADGSAGTSRKRLPSDLEAEETHVLSDSFFIGESRTFERRKVASEPAHAVTAAGRTVYPTRRWERKGLRGDLSDLNKRDVPFLPGNLFCPATDSDIASTAVNCDPYAGDATPLSRRHIAEEPRSLREEDSIPETIRSGEDPDEGHWLSKRASTPPTLKTCPGFTIPIPAFASLFVNAYYDLASPATLNGNINGYANMPPYYINNAAGGAPSLGGATNGLANYGREHVYEQSMSSLFIDYMGQFPVVWDDDSGDDFCDWATNNLWTVPAYMPANSAPVINQIGLCYPSQANSAQVGIPVLEQRTNEYKQSAFYVTEQNLDPTALNTASGIVNTGTFRNSCPTAQVGILRSLAMITPFMNSLPARTQFLRINTCIRGVYSTWYTAYLAAHPTVTTLLSVAEFLSEYDSWIRQLVSGMQGAVVAQMNTLIPLYNGGDNTAVDIKLSTNAVLSTWAKLNPPVAAATAWAPTNNLNTAFGGGPNLISIQSVSTANLQALAANVPQINWLNQLP